MSVRRSEGFWYGHVEAWRESGQARVEYCTRNTLDEFGLWVLETSGDKHEKSGPPQFYEYA